MFVSDALTSLTPEEALFVKLIVPPSALADLNVFSDIELSVSSVMMNFKDMFGIPSSRMMCNLFPFEKGLFSNNKYLTDSFKDKDELDSIIRTSAGFAGLKQSLLEKSPFDLSGGEKRRAAIAGVIAMQPKVLILDEPTAGLDPKGRNRILDRIRTYREETGSTVLLVSHSMEDIARVADRVLVMNHGKVEMFDKTENIFKHGERLAEIGLRVPQVTQVFLELKRLGADVRTDVYTMEFAKGVALQFLNASDSGSKPADSPAVKPEESTKEKQDENTLDNSTDTTEKTEGGEAQ